MFGPKLASLAFIGGIGVPELLIILLIVIIIFGATRLPQLGKGLGQGLKNFKDSVKPEEPREKNSPPPPSA